MTKSMTPRQRDLLEAVLYLTVAQGFSPSISEVATRLRVSKTRAYQLAQAAMDRGYLDQKPGTARSWRLSHAGVAAIAWGVS